ncbi:EAL domain-containing protein, partial [Enterobacter kobei]|uniref:EAL domain-containing protein n=1 Tax=Enterobacter kobei TaxID=208224 RepID=UPI00292AC8D0
KRAYCLKTQPATGETYPKSDLFNKALRKFQFDGLKLDKSFIFTLADSPQNQSVVEKIIDLGKAYSMEVTAEGVETSEQLAFLKKNKCDEVQGYLLGKPAAIAALNLNANLVNT